MDQQGGFPPSKRLLKDVRKPGCRWEFRASDDAARTGNISTLETALRYHNDNEFETVCRQGLRLDAGTTTATAAGGQLTALI